MIEVTKKDFSVDDVLARFHSPEMGALVSFVGVVRNQSKKRVVDRIEIQVYEEMALRQLEAVREEALKRFDISDLSIIHRHGDLKISEKILMIAVGASHRKDAFDACSYVLEALKNRVPIWKKEISPEGDFWVEGEKP
jgi:molybdopterin synthase catalytic subunit